MPLSYPSSYSHSLSATFESLYHSLSLSLSLFLTEVSSNFSLFLSPTFTFSGMFCNGHVFDVFVECKCACDLGKYSGNREGLSGGGGKKYELFQVRCVSMRKSSEQKVTQTYMQAVEYYGYNVQSVSREK